MAFSSAELAFPRALGIGGDAARDAGSGGGSAWTGWWWRMLADLLPGQWLEVPGTHLRDVAGPNPGTGDVSCVMSCWAAGAFDAQRERLYVTGGRHQGYA